MVPLLSSEFVEKFANIGNQSPTGASNELMTTQSRYRVLSRCAVIVLFALLALSSRAATIWTGPNITFTKSGSVTSDTIVPGKVVLKRNASGVLVNTAAGETFPGTTSPKDTLWAFGTLANFSTLTYQSMDSLRNGNLSARIVNQNMVVHLINEDIYFSIKFTTWGMHGAGTVSYVRSTAPVSTAPTVSIATPANGTVYASPAAIALTANATVAGGTVTNVEYFAGTVSLGKAGTSPFAVTGNLTTPGSYALTAVATASGVSSTSAVVNVTVIAPVDVSLTTPTLVGNTFSFNYSANAGLRYRVESASNLSSLANWTPIVTNTPASGTATYSETFSPANPARFFRVGRLANP